MTISFTIYGPPRTKKNHGRIVRTGKRPRLLPSKAFEEWNKVAQPQLAKLRHRYGLMLPFRQPMNCKAIFWRHANVGDLLGFEQALADALEEGGIVENDRLITQWDGSRMYKNAVSPHIEVTLTELQWE